MAVATVAILLLFAEYFSRPQLRKIDPQASPWHSMLAKMEDVVVFEWPVSHPSRITERSDTFYMHWLHPALETIAEWIQRVALPHYMLLDQMRSFPDATSIQYLQRAGATILVVHDVPNSRVPHDTHSIAWHVTPPSACWPRTRRRPQDRLLRLQAR